MRLLCSYINNKHKLIGNPNLVMIEATKSLCLGIRGHTFKPCHFIGQRLYMPQTRPQIYPKSHASVDHKPEV